MRKLLPHFLSFIFLSLPSLSFLNTSWKIIPYQGLKLASFIGISTCDVLFSFMSKCTSEIPQNVAHGPAVINELHSGGLQGINIQFSAWFLTVFLWHLLFLIRYNSVCNKIQMYEMKEAIIIQHLAQGVTAAPAPCQLPLPSPGLDHCV